MNCIVNMNTGVRVKLTNYGENILRERYDRIRENHKSSLEEFALHLDEDGYYRTQLWVLMRDFGHSFGIANHIPFMLDIIIENGEPLETKLFDSEMKTYENNN